jgi:hypothetical protein
LHAFVEQIQASRRGLFGAMFRRLWRETRAGIECTALLLCYEMPNSLVTIARFHGLGDAAVAKHAMDTAGIDAEVEDVRLEVHHEDAYRAFDCGVCGDRGAWDCDRSGDWADGRGVFCGGGGWVVFADVGSVALHGLRRVLELTIWRSGSMRRRRRR